MTPDWLLQIMWWSAGIGGGGAVWYFLSQRSYHAVLWTSFTTIVVVFLAISLHIRNDLLRSEQQRVTAAHRPASERPAVTNPSATVAPSVAEGSGHAIQKMTDPARGVTVERIVDEINSSPPYQKDTIAKNFTGLERTCAPWQIAKKVNPKLDAGEGLLSCRHRLS